jgi:hypothetical protein
MFENLVGQLLLKDLVNSGQPSPDMGAASASAQPQRPIYPVGVSGVPQERQPFSQPTDDTQTLQSLLASAAGGGTRTSRPPVPKPGGINMGTLQPQGQPTAPSLPWQSVSYPETTYARQIVPVYEAGHKEPVTQDTFDLRRIFNVDSSFQTPEQSAPSPSGRDKDELAKTHFEGRGYDQLEPWEKNIIDESYTVPGVSGAKQEKPIVKRTLIGEDKVTPHNLPQKSASLSGSALIQYDPSASGRVLSDTTGEKARDLKDWAATHSHLENVGNVLDSNLSDTDPRKVNAQHEWDDTLHRLTQDDPFTSYEINKAWDRYGKQGKDVVIKKLQERQQWLSKHGASPYTNGKISGLNSQVAPGLDTYIWMNTPRKKAGSP